MKAPAKITPFMMSGIDVMYGFKDAYLHTYNMYTNDNDNIKLQTIYNRWH